MGYCNKRMAQMTSMLHESVARPAAPVELATFGPVHLDVVDRHRSLRFWRDVVGLRLVSEERDAVSLGTSREVLVVLRPGATSPVRRGHAGLYHVAIHLPSEPEFGRVLGRLLAHRWPIAPTDHTVSKAIYLNDPDGIGLELTLETPDRVASNRIIGTRIELVDKEGRAHGPSEPLETAALLTAVPERDFEPPVPDGTTVGHLHLHVSDLDAGLHFYRDQIGMLEHQHAPQLGFFDVHAGGTFPHRIAANIWQGIGASQSPPGTTGLRYFTVRFDSSGRLRDVLNRVDDVEQRDDGAMVRDPSGNTMLLTGPS
jgi:catechol 2,3-dioxygenase